MTEISKCLRQYRQTIFNHESKYQPYCVSRSLNQYLETLPKFQEKDLLEIVDEKILSKGQSPIKILDIGCGEGKFLLDCKEKWGSNIDCFGLSAFPYHDEEGSSLFPYDEEMSFNSVLKTKGVDIKIGDVHRLYDLVPNNNFDVVTSATAFRYFAHPATALKMIYQTLRYDGICLINDFDVSREFRPYIDDLNELYDFLKKTYGFEFRQTLRSLSFQKKSKKLTLPISFNKRPNDGLYSIEEDAKFVYRIK
jgi:ubiquinone/menaquinone biosynthesis C-methylase UbiE